MKNNWKIISIVGLAIVLFCMVTIISFIHEIKNVPLPVFGEVKDFSLTDTENKTISLADLKGKVWVADFIFTTCGHICPIMSKHMASLHRSYLLEEDTAMVSISVNPEFDTPKILNDYAKRYNADTKHWHFLTGSRDAIKDLAVNGFKIGSVEDPVFHSTYFVLVDKTGKIRGYYEGTKIIEVQRLFKDIAFVLKEQRS